MHECERQFCPTHVYITEEEHVRTTHKGKLVGSFGKAHPSGWVQLNIFLEWLQHFIKCTNLTSKHPMLLSLDSHYRYSNSLIETFNHFLKCFHVHYVENITKFPL